MRFKVFCTAALLCLIPGAAFAAQDVQVLDNVQASRIAGPATLTQAEFEQLFEGLDLEVKLLDLRRDSAAPSYVSFSRYNWDVTGGISSDDGLALYYTKFRNQSVIYHASFPWFGLNDDPCGLEKFELRSNDLLGGPWLFEGFHPDRGPFVTLFAYYWDRDGSGAYIVQQFQFYMDGYFVPVIQYWHPTGQMIATAPLYVDFDLRGSWYDAAKCPDPATPFENIYIPFEFASEEVLPVFLTDLNSPATVEVAVNPAHDAVQFVMNYGFYNEIHPMLNLQYPSNAFERDNVHMYMMRNVPGDFSYHEIVYFVTP